MKAGILAMALALLFTTTAFSETPYPVAWTAQIGTSYADSAHAVALDALGNVYVSGWVLGDLAGPGAGNYDAFLRKFDSSGQVLWTRQFGTSGYDFSSSVSVDASGDVYIGGWTQGDIGGPNAGLYDGFLRKYDALGNQLWTTQLGTIATDTAYSVATDASGNIFVSGKTAGDLGATNAGGDDAFLSKLDSSGNVSWTRQIGTSTDDSCDSVAVDAFGNAYITGSTRGDLGGSNAGGTDVFLSKFDSAGDEVWRVQSGTSDWEEGWDVAVDASGNVYVCGGRGEVNPNIRDAHLTKFDSDGNEIWTTQLAASATDTSYSVAVDDDGNVFITGETKGDLGGTNAGYSDVFLCKFDSLGNELWISQLGTDRSEQGYAVALDASGVYVVGDTSGDLGGPNVGAIDGFIVKYQVPEPTTLLFLGCGAVALLRRRG
jgi:hypothetical protein